VFAAGVAVNLVAVSLSYYSQVSDHEVLNGQVTSKRHEDVSCRHSYECRCRQVPSSSTQCSGTGSSRSCRSVTTYRRVCDTCYEHSFDREWWVYSDIGQTEIDSVSRQGLTTPPRWDKAIVGEPYAQMGFYKNYLLAAKDSLFRTTASPTMLAKVPTYGSTYDYYRFDHARAVDVDVPNLKEWNVQLANTLKLIASRKQVNINVLFTKLDRTFAEALESEWVGGKKNDVTVVIGVKEWPKVEWVQVFTFARSAGNELTTIQIRDAILANPEFLSNPQVSVSTIGSIVSKTYKRKSMEEFEYVLQEATPTIKTTVITVILLIILMGVMTYFFSRNDLRAE
jgi:hypothetical protein